MENPNSGKAGLARLCVAVCGGVDKPALEELCFNTCNSHSKKAVPWYPAELLAAHARRCPGTLPSIQPRAGSELAALVRFEDLRCPRSLGKRLTPGLHTEGASRALARFQPSKARICQSMTDIK